ncbi:hypothetical protein ACXX9E_19760 [Pseudomonas sp. GNP014]
MTDDLPAWMVEAAYRYLRAAEHLLRGYDLLDIAQINAAIGVEILLKSFISVPNSNHGKANQTYEVDTQLLKPAHQLLQGLGKISVKKTSPDRHDLLTLYHAIPEQIRSSIGLDRQAEKLERCRHIFTGSRYQYEKNTPKGYDSTLIEVLRDLLPRVVEYHRQLGSQDLFIRCYGMPPMTLDQAHQQPD